MCNNYASQGKRATIVEAFDQLGMQVVTAEEGPSSDIRPTDAAPIVRGVVGGVELVARRWGLAPARAKAGAVTNWRSEGRTFDRGRCLIPATSFYEYTGETYPKTRWRFALAGAEWFCIAGVWRPEQGTAQEERFTMLTMAPGPDVEPYHDRQVVILDRRDWPRWLAGDPVAASWFEPLPPGTLTVEHAGGPAPAPRLL